MNKLLPLLSAATLLGAAQLARAQDPAAAAPTTCLREVTDCVSAEGLLFRLRTRSWNEPVTQGAPEGASSERLQPDRRVTIEKDQHGRAEISGKVSMDVPGGGLIWATEDPALGETVLSISAPDVVAFDGRRILEPVHFHVRSNYPAFVQDYEISLYRASDGDLVEPILKFQLPPAGVTQYEWNGELPDKFRPAVGDEIVFVLRAHGRAGGFDETWPQTLQLVTPAQAERHAQRLNAASERPLATASAAVEQSLVDSVFAENRLRQHNIRVRGSRIRIEGRNLPADRSLTINGASYPIDFERKFVAEYLVPLGTHEFAIALSGGGHEEVKDVLSVQVDGRYFFGTAIADFTASGNDIDGSRATFADDPRAGDDTLYDGRMAFYLKTKVRAKYLITAQADTTERDLEHLFDGFGDAEPRDVFRQLDPDMYYPTYGDDSTTYRDVDTQGRFYARVDWDQNQALWGNYATGFTDTEFAQYTRALYGGAADWSSQHTNAWGEAGTSLRVFGSQAESAPGHSEFVGTGGSLYYLKHAGILPGSDSVVLEVRDRSTGRVENRVPLKRDADYEIDDLQGRLLLSRPLAQVTRENIFTLTRDAPLDGYEQRLIVDYEWVPSGFDADEVTAGARGKHWFGDHLALGATYVDENRSGDDYTLLGGDMTLQAGRGTYLKAEYTETEATSAPSYLSLNGGLSFYTLNSANLKDGAATSLEGRVNLHELGWTSREVTFGTWWRDVDAGFSVNRFDPDFATQEYGAELLGYFTDQFSLYSRVSRAQRGDVSLDQAQLTADWRVTPQDSLAAEVRTVDAESFTDSGTGTLAALKYTRRLGTALDLYALGQAVVDDDHGAYPDNNSVTLGARYLYGDRSTVGMEVTDGDRGDAVQFSSEFRMSPEQTVYGSYTFSTDTTESESQFNPNRQNGATLGQRWRLSDQVSLFNESQYLKAPDASGLAHMFGMDFFPAKGWNLGFAAQKGDLINFDGALVDRRALSVRGGRSSRATDWQSKLEWREDSGGENRRQWVSTNRLMHKLNEDWRLALRFNYSETDDPASAAFDARFVEGSAGFAWRPVHHLRWAAFGRYSYLYDVSSLAQSAGASYDQKTRIASLEAVFKPAAAWEFSGRGAWREGAVRFARRTGPWWNAAAGFAGLQMRYDLYQQWHALAAWRWLEVTDGGARNGALVGLDRDIGANFRLGVGYNFTDFSDDLTDFSYDQRGWFMNVLGKY